MSFKVLARIAKNAAIGGAAGYFAGRVVSDAVGAEAGGNKGAQIGALVGGVTGLPIKSLALKAGAASKVFYKGLEHTRGSGVRSAKAAGKIMFRRIRGRIVPIFKSLKGG